MNSERKEEVADPKTDAIIEKLVGMKDKQGRRFIEHLGKEKVLESMSSETLKKIEDEFQKYENSRVDLIDFVKVFLKLIDHEESERIFLVVSIIEFFKEMSETMNLGPNVSAQDISNFMVDNYMERNLSTYSIPTKLLPPANHFSIDLENIRTIDIDAPIVYGQSLLGLRRQDPLKISTDSFHHTNPIKEAYYSSNLRKLFTLDVLSDTIVIYNKNVVVEKLLRPKCSKKKDPSIVMSFAFSENGRRIGACLKNFTLSFWDLGENQTFEKSVNSSLEIADYQVKIWRLELFDKWITTDNTGVLYIWDLIEEKVSQRLVTKFLKKDPTEAVMITDVVEIEYLRLIAVSSSDKHINIWNFLNGMVVISMNLPKGGVHQIRHFKTYQLILTAGYENTIPAFSITPHYNDINLMGRLVGHLSMVTSLTVIEGTPMVVSADDSGVVRTWDIRSQRCLQTVELGHRTVINKMLIVENSLAMFGARVTLIEFDEPYEQPREKGDHDDQLFPIMAEYNDLTEEIFLCLRNEVRVLDSMTGKPKKIFKSFFTSEEEDELTVLKFQQRSKKFILGDHKGNINVYNYGTGELIRRLDPHHKEVNMIKIDYANKLIVTCGRDNRIKIQREREKLADRKKIKEGLEEQANDEFKKEEREIMKMLNGANASIPMVFRPNQISETKKKVVKAAESESESRATKRESNESEVLRSIRKVNNGEEIVAMDVSSHHNLIAVGFETKIVLIDYEYMKSLWSINMNKDDDLMTLSILNEFMFLLVGSSKGFIHFLGIKMKENNILDVYFIGHIMNGSNSPENIPSKILLDFNYKKKRKNPTLLLYEGDKQSGENESGEKESGNDEYTIDFDECDLYVSDTKGTITRFGLKDWVSKSKVTLTPGIKGRANYNAYRILDETYRPPAQTTSLTDEDDTCIFPYKTVARFKAHKEALTNLQFIFTPWKYLMTASTDHYLKVFTITGNLLCSINMNHPLPILWNFPYDIKKKAKTKLLFALKIVDSAFKRNYATMHGEPELLGIHKFLCSLLDIKKNPDSKKKSTLQRRTSISMPNFFEDESNLKSHLAKKTNKSRGNPEEMRLKTKENEAQKPPTLEEISEIHEKERNSDDNGDGLNSERGVKGTFYTETGMINQKEGPTRKVAVMKDTYTAKDLAFDKIKNFEAEEIRGLTLKQMEMVKKLNSDKREAVKEKLEKEKLELQVNAMVMATVNNQKQVQPAFFEDYDLGGKKGYRPKNKQAFEFMRRLELLIDPKSITPQEKEAGLLPLGVKPKHLQAAQEKAKKAKGKSHFSSFLQEEVKNTRRGSSKATGIGKSLEKALGVGTSPEKKTMSVISQFGFGVTPSPSKKESAYFPLIDNSNKKVAKNFYDYAFEKNNSNQQNSTMTSIFGRKQSDGNLTAYMAKTGNLDQARQTNFGSFKGNMEESKTLGSSFMKSGSLPQVSFARAKNEERKHFQKVVFGLQGALNQSKNSFRSGINSETLSQAYMESTATASGFHPKPHAQKNPLETKYIKGGHRVNPNVNNEPKSKREGDDNVEAEVSPERKREKINLHELMQTGVFKKMMTEEEKNRLINFYKKKEENVKEIILSAEHHLNKKIQEAKEKQETFDRRRRQSNMSNMLENIVGDDDEEDTDGAGSFRGIPGSLFSDDTGREKAKRQTRGSFMVTHQSFY